MGEKILEANCFWAFTIRNKTSCLVSKNWKPFSPPQTFEIVPCTSNPKSSRHAHNRQKPIEYPKHQLLPPLMDAFEIEHVLPKLPLDPFMMWCLHWVNREWHKVMGEPLEQHCEISQFVLLPQYCYPRTSKVVFETMFAIWTSMLEALLPRWCKHLKF